MVLACRLVFNGAIVPTAAFIPNLGRIQTCSPIISDAPILSILRETVLGISHLAFVLEEPMAPIAVVLGVLWMLQQERVMILFTLTIVQEAARESNNNDNNCEPLNVAAGPGVLCKKKGNDGG